MIGAGAVVTRDVPAHSLVAGAPATIRGYLDQNDQPIGPRPASGLDRHSSSEEVRGVFLRQLTRAEDMRGRIAIAETDQELPFVPRRVFMVHNVPSTEVRGEHAHRRCEQFLVCAAGRVMVQVDDGTARAEYELSSPNVGLYVPPMVWAAQYQYTDDAVLVVLASDPYDPDDYIRDYGTFCSLVQGEHEK